MTAGLAGIECSSGHLSGTMFRAGAYASLFVYLVVAGLTAVVFIFQAGDSLRWLLALEGIWLGLLMIVLMIISASSASTAKTNRELHLKAGQLRQLESRLKDLQAKYSSEPWAPALAQMAEVVKFSNRACSVSTDTLIEEKITALETLLESPENHHSMTSDEIYTRITELEKLIICRSEEASSLARGDY